MFFYVLFVNIFIHIHCILWVFSYVEEMFPLRAFFRNEKFQDNKTEPLNLEGFPWQLIKEKVILDEYIG